MPELRVRNVNKTFNGNKVLHDINFEVHDGEFFTLLGPSGCGKSTTLAAIAGLDKPDEGTIELDDVVFFSGKNNVFVPPEGRNLGMVFQSYALWPHMTIADNLALPLSLRKVPKVRRNELIDDALEKVDLPPPAQPLPPRDVRRPATARRTGSRTGLLAACPASRRAIVQPRRQVA